MTAAIPSSRPRSTRLWPVVALLLLPGCNATAARDDAIEKLKTFGAKIEQDEDGSVRKVDLKEIRIVDDNLDLLAPFTKLEELRLEKTGITDAGLEKLKQLKTLKVLNLGECVLITDAGLAHLGDLAELTKCDLYGTPITDAGLGHLSGLSKLERIWVGGTQVTDDGVAKLEKALPNCTIVRQ